MNGLVRVGIDLGGTKIEGILLVGRDEIVRLRVDTPRDDYAATVEAVASLAEALERRAGAQGSIGVGIPGTMSAGTGRIKNANSIWLIGKPLRDDLTRRLRRDVRMANDANCFAISEATDGAAAGADVVFGVIVGTGVGGGIVVRGQVVAGAHGIAGEWGHNGLPWPRDGERPGPRCYCGQHGCIETFLSGPGLMGDFERQAGRRELPQAIAAAATQGDPEAEAALSRYEDRMARSLASIINVLDPDVIVLGGGMSNVERLYTNVPMLWKSSVFNRGETGGLQTRLVRAMHGDSSGVRGAAWLWNAE